MILLAFGGLALIVNKVLTTEYNWAFSNRSVGVCDGNRYWSSRVPCPWHHDLRRRDIDRRNGLATDRRLAAGLTGNGHREFVYTGGNIVRLIVFVALFLFAMHVPSMADRDCGGSIQPKHPKKGWHPRHCDVPKPFNIRKRGSSCTYKFNKIVVYCPDTRPEVPPIPTPQCDRMGNPLPRDYKGYWYPCRCDAKGRRVRGGKYECPLPRQPEPVKPSPQRPQRCEVYLTKFKPSPASINIKFEAGPRGPDPEPCTVVN